MIKKHKLEALRFSFYILMAHLVFLLGNTQPTLKISPSCLMKLQDTKVKLIT